MTKHQAIKYFGSSKALAEALGVTPQAVSGWKGIPARRQYEIERITNGALKADVALIRAA